MAVQYSNAAKNARMTAIATLMQNGSLQIGTTGMATVLATFALDATPATVAGAGVLTLSDLPVNDSAADNTGTAAAARFRDSANGDIITGLTVGLTGSGADIIIQNTSIVAGQPVSITSGTITHAA